MSGLAVLGLGLSLGYNCGYPLNPARDLAPRLLMGNTTNYSLQHVYYTRHVSVNWNGWVLSVCGINTGNTGAGIANSPGRHHPRSPEVITPRCCEAGKV